MSVIREIPVFLNKAAKDDLLLIEYPTRPKHLPINDSRVIEFKYKPKHQLAELSVSASSRSGNYDDHRGQQFGSAAPELFDGGRFDRRLFRSRAEFPSGRHAVAVVRAGRLCLCPLEARLSMRPALDHLDQQLLKQQQQQQQQQQAGSAEAEAKAVTVRFARHETPEARQRREQTFRACQREQDQEPWLTCHWLGAGAFVDEPLTSGTPGVDSATHSTVSHAGARYLSHLSPKPQAQEAADARPDATAGVSLARLKAMPCQDILRALLKSACVLRWQQLVDLLKQCGMTQQHLVDSHQRILNHLTDIACLVRGVWVVKSEALYPPGTVSQHSGVSAETLCRGRDYILCRFVQGRAVSKKEIASLLRVPSEETSAILNRISRPVRREGAGQMAPKMRFVFDGGEDPEFVRRNPEVVKLATNYWDTKWKLLTDQLKLDKAKANRDRLLLLSSDLVVVRRSRSRSARYSSSSSSCSDYGDGDADSGRQRRRSYSRRQCVSMSESGQEDSAGRRPEEDEDVVEFAAPQAPPSRSLSAGDAENGNDEVDGGAASDSLVSELSEFLRRKLADRLLAGYRELHQFYSFQAAAAANGAEGCRQLPREPDACVRLFDAAAVAAGLFVLEAGGSVRVYAHATDERRRLLLRHLARHEQITVPAFRDKCRAAGLELASDAAAKAVIKDYCSFRGKAYYLKVPGL